MICNLPHFNYQLLSMQIANKELSPNESFLEKVSLWPILQHCKKKDDVSEFFYQVKLNDENTTLIIC